MKKIKTFVVMMMVAVMGLASSFEASAQNSSVYEAKSCKEVANKNSACNQGVEPFYVFLKKFKTNKKFMKSRVKSCKKKNCKHCTPGLEGVIDGYDNFYHEFKTFKLKKTWVKDESDVSGGYYGTETASWMSVSKNTVTYVYDADLEFGWSIWYIFERINGKWYLTHYAGLP